MTPRRCARRPRRQIGRHVGVIPVDIDRTVRPIIQTVAATGLAEAFGPTIGPTAQRPNRGAPGPRPGAPARTSKTADRPAGPGPGASGFEPATCSTAADAVV